MILLQWCVLLCLLLCPWSSCPACRPAQQLGWIAMAKVELPVEGERGCAILWCHCASGTQLCACSILTLSCPDCHRSLFGRSLVRNYKSLKIGPCGPCKQRVQKENCHISRFFLSILSSMAAPATDKRVWIHCLCVAKVIILLCNTFWNQAAWMEYEMLSGKLESILKIFPWQNE